MHTKEEIRSEIESAFDNSRPDVLCVADGDPESSDHAMMWNDRDRDSLSFEDVFVEGSYPYNALTPDGLAYFLPAIARIALDSEGRAVDGEWCGIPFVIGVLGRQPNHFLSNCTIDQRRAVAHLVDFLIQTGSRCDVSPDDRKAMLAVLDMWKQGADSSTE